MPSRTTLNKPGNIESDEPAMLFNLLKAFGFIGVLSVLLWAVAGVALVRVWWRGGRRRAPRLLAVLALALLAVLATRPAWRRLAAIGVDRREEVARAAAVAAAKAETQAAAVPSGPALPRFAEAPPAAADEPAYRQRGRQARVEGTRSLSGDELETLIATPADADPSRRAGELLLPEADRRRALRLGRLNRRLAGGVFWLTLLALGTDYFRKYRSLADCYLPVPLDGRWWNRLFSKPALQRIGTLPLQRLAETLVRRGETFIYCGGAAFADEALPRLKVGLLEGGYLPPLRLPPLAVDADLELLLDAAWFGRAFGIVQDQAAALRLLDLLEDYLAVRRLTRATAARTVYLIWDFPVPPDNPRWDALIATSHERNIRWLLPGPAH